MTPGFSLSRKPEMKAFLENINTASIDVYKSNKQRGFDSSMENFSQTLMLIVSELSECQAAHRSGRAAKVTDFRLKYVSFNDQMAEACNDEEQYNKVFVEWYKKNFEEYIKDSLEDELADTIIRLMDLCGAFGIDIAWHITHKLAYNSFREYKHGKRY